ncbi:uncharacterized protein EI90DRAFT_442604 [Cantharellus anzutake]|uniref:uncharacterized protein n=1 Tax=Cantharellus anzutake TaxID=1750568 RepID=UPI0019049061|nr:uncharacterized protein EI90DRAFT_442604 [Cantharellus anzutake]KAF8334605.1 hypothetical protein EI90DRAFT_442604 [Cantharellus anzutake]
MDMHDSVKRYTCVCNYTSSYKSNMTRHQHSCWWIQKQEKTKGTSGNAQNRPDASQATASPRGRIEEGTRRSLSRLPDASTSRPFSSQMSPPIRTSPHLSSSSSSPNSRSPSLGSEDSSVNVALERRNATYPPSPPIPMMSGSRPRPQSPMGREYGGAAIHHSQSRSAQEARYFGTDALTTDSPSPSSQLHDGRLEQHQPLSHDSSGHPVVFYHQRRSSTSPVSKFSHLTAPRITDDAPHAPEVRRFAANDGVVYSEPRDMTSLKSTEQSTDVSLVPAQRAARLPSYMSIDCQGRPSATSDSPWNAGDFGDGFARLSLTDSVLPHDGLRRNALVPLSSGQGEATSPDTASFASYCFPVSGSQSSARNVEQHPNVGYSVGPQESWMSFIQGAGLQIPSPLDAFGSSLPSHPAMGLYSGQSNDQWALWTPPESP